MEDYKKKYEDALERARIWKEKSGMPIDKQGILDNIFPELKKSEGEESKKWILEYLHDGLRKSDEQFKDQFKSAIAWLEKQGEKPQGKSAVEAAKEEKSDNRNCINNADKDEHEFQVGDWVISKRNRNVYHILNIEDNEYQVETLYGIFWYDKLYFEGFCRHWNIDDAKPGDVLASSKSIFIFKRIYMAGKPEAYYAVMNDSFKSFIKCPNACWTNEQCHPATKEQRELFFRKMKEAGYEWNAEKKELKKIEQKPAWSEEDIEKPITIGKRQLTGKAKELYDNLDEKSLAETKEKMLAETSKWTEEDESMCKGLISYFNYNPLKYSEESVCNWLKSIKERLL